MNENKTTKIESTECLMKLMNELDQLAKKEVVGMKPN